ncbi:MAG: CPBP family intramembrane metalloprotease [Anaerolineae bacterium]|nr:CPBP family intramembrane metalloprotease [Anaerolineae bacterium]
MSESTQPERASILKWIGTPQMPPPWSLLDAGIALLALLLTMTIVATSIAVGVTGGASTTSPQQSAFILGWAIASLITTAFVLIRWRRNNEMWQALRIVRPQMALPLIFLLGIATTLTVDVIAGLLNGTFLPVAALYGLGDASNEWMLAAIFLVIAQPLAESLVFFGVIQARLRASIGPWAGYLAAVLLFTVFHALVFATQLPEGASLWYGVIYPALIGLFLGALRIRSGSTVAVIVAYAAMGLTAIFTGLAIVG